mgnify:CR=1 FL=1
MLPTAFPTELTALLVEAGVTDVLLAGASACQVVRAGRLETRPTPFADERSVDRLAVDLIAAGGRQLDVAHPFADVVLSDFRVHAALRSDCSRQTQISIRNLGQRPPALSSLGALGMFDDRVGGALRQLVEQRHNFLISGPTGSGKTSLLRAMLAHAGGERILTIEDIPELRLGGGAVELVTRRANSEGVGEVSMERLLVEALRMRPDRLVVGELRSNELLVLLQAMNSGHEGAGATIHANSLQGVPNRLRGIAAGCGLGFAEVDALAASAFDWIIQLGVIEGMRRVVGVGRLVLGAGGGLHVEEVAL